MQIDEHYKPQTSSRKRNAKYANASLAVRSQLIQMIEQQGTSVVVAANKLKMNYSTAKSIIRLFRKEGRIKNVKTAKVEEVPLSNF